MASTAFPTPTISHPSPRHSTRSGGGRMASPWTNIVRGGETDAAIASPIFPSSPSARDVISFSEASVTDEQTVVSSLPPVTGTSYTVPPDAEGLDDSNGNAGKRPAWNKPSNGAAEIGPVMGALSWPALSESARVSGKPSQDSSKGLSDGSSASMPVVQVPGSASSSSPKHVSNNANPNSNPNHTMPIRQRSMKRNGGNTSANGGNSQPPGSQSVIGEVHLNNTSPRELAQRNSQSRSGNDHPQQQRNSYRRNSGLHSRGDGSHHHNYGGRRDQDRTNQDWNSHRNFNGRDAHMQQHRVAQRYARHPPAPPPPPSTAPFIAAPPVRGFGSPIGFPELGSPLFYVAAPPPDLRSVPFVATPMPHHPMYFNAADLQLHSKIVIQIDYYFSNENLIKDTFLRQNMDEQGWVPIKLIAGFNKVSHLTDNVQLILDAIRNSTIVEVQGDKVRRRNDWMRWIMPPVQFSNASVPQSSPGGSSHDMLAGQIQSISLEDTGSATSHGSGETFLGRSISGDLALHASPAEGAGWVSAQGGLDASTLARTSSK